MTTEEMLREQLARANQRIEALEAQIEAGERAARAADARLDEAAEFLREVYRTLPGAVMIIGDNGLIQAVNSGAAALLEYSEKELIGKPAAIVFDPENVPDVAEIEALALESRILRTELEYCTKSDRTIPVLFSAAALGGAHQGQDGPRRIVCIAIDIRDRKRLELELRQAQKLESVGRLAAGVAHELNTPIQFVSDSIQFVSEAVSDLFMLVEKLQLVRSAAAKGLLSAEAIAAALEAEQAADLPYLRDNLPKALQRSIDGLGRVATIVRSMKEFAQPDAREMSAVDLNEMIENTLTIAGNEYRSIADVVTDLGPIPRVLCHAGEVGQAILNIIINAADAIGEVASAPGQRGRITVRTRLEGATVLVAISDTGAGIPEAIRDQIFDPFFTTKAIGRGTGQGLTVSRAVVADRHGGALTFETEVGRGTTFFLRFPIGGSAADPARARP